jgi:hypothetical protein
MPRNEETSNLRMLSRLSRSTRPLLILLSCIAGFLAFVLWHFWLFKERTQINPALGRITYKFRWSFAHEIERDIDQDGIVDQRAFLPPGTREFTDQSIPAEIWADGDHDGRFEAHGTLDAEGIVRIEIDSNNDGKVDRILDREAAKAFLRAMEIRPKS